MSWELQRSTFLEKLRTGFSSLTAPDPNRVSLFYLFKMPDGGTEGESRAREDVTQRVH